MSDDSALRPRKRPLQRRSRETVEAILEAAAQVFAKSGYAEGTTNRIAERAGVSVGSLYQYFPNKDALLVALVDREVEAGMERMTAWIERSRRSPRDLEELLRSFVEAMLDLHRASPELHRLLFEEAAHPPEAHECVLRFEERLAHGWRTLLCEHGEVDARDPDTAAHFLVQTTEALTHRFVFQGLHQLEAPAFVRELVSLLHRYLTAGGVGGAAGPAPSGGSG